MNEYLDSVKKINKEVVLLEHTAAVLGWDQETYMPEAAVEERAEQLALLQGLIHDRIVGDDLAKALHELGVDDTNPAGSSSLDDADRGILRETYRRYKRSTKLPKDLVVELAEKVSISQNAWIKARQSDSFEDFAPHLGELINLQTRAAHCIGFQDHPYDALLDEFEPYMTSRELDVIFAGLEKKLIPLVQQIKQAKPIDDSFLLHEFPVDRQREFSMFMLNELGYDQKRGRIDETAHPFTTTLGRDDVRITTRYNKDFFKTGIFGTIHECGHALYEMGFGPDVRNTLIANGTSLGIHESQSRFWENMVGRSEAFWYRYLPRLKEFFPAQLGGIDTAHFYRAVNKVEPSLIRVEADEVTYSLHIILRFKLEMQLLSGALKVDELPDAWNQLSRDLFGIAPDSNANGVLQDIHWSMGAFGYFPTYALGNLYAAQFSATMEKQLGSLDSLVEEGRFADILTWLRENIHIHGAGRTASELCIRTCSESLNPDFFIDYLQKKYSRVYGL